MGKEMCLAVDECNPRALGITVPSPVFSTSLVMWVLRKTAIRIHPHEEEGPIESAGEIRNVHVKSELFVPQIEHLVTGVVSHEVHPRANIGGVTVLGDEFDGDCAAGRCDPITCAKNCAFQCAVLSAGYGVGTYRRVPRAIRVTGCRALCGVQRAPFGVDGDGCGECMTVSACCAFLDAEFGMDFLRLCAYLLAVHNGEVDRQQGNYRVHHWE